MSGYLNYGYLNYEPMEKQRLFHNSRAKFRLYASGMGAGKTTGGAFETLDIAQAYPNNLILVGRATYPELRDTTRREVLEFPVVVDGKEMELISSPWVKSFNKAENSLVLINKTEILFRALEDSFDKIKSLNLGAFWVDELTEVPEEIWLGLVGRLRRKGVWHTGFGTTNPEGHDWVWKRWVMSPDADHFCVTATSAENFYLPDGYIDSMIKNYPDEWVKRYVMGSFDTFEGLVYHEFKDTEPFVVKPFEIPEEWYKFVALDHGYRNPTAVLWFAVNPKGHVYVYDELYERKLLVSEIANIIKTKEHRQNIKMYLIDPSCRNKNGVTGLSVMDEFEKEKLFFEPANNDVRAGVNRVKEYLRGDKEKGSRLHIFNTCRNLRTEFQTYQWKHLKPGAIQDAPEKPIKKDDHLLDALRYGVAYLYDTPELKPKEKGWKWRDYLRIGNEPSTPSWKAA